MKRQRLLTLVLLLVTGGVALVTTGTCYNFGTAFGYEVYSTNDNLVEDVLGLFCCEDDDD
jgi:hypothetical protein